MPEKISIVKESGETVSSNIVSVFTIPDTEKKYIITTENAVDPHGLTVLHVSEIVDGSLKKIATDEEWSSIKTIMRAIISGNVGSYKYLPAIEVIKAEGQYSRDISVSASAAKQMVDNYNAADTSATEEEATASDASIFPEGGSAPDEDNEVMPGISEVTDDAPALDEAPAPEAPAPEAIPAEPEPAAPVDDAPALDDTPLEEAPAEEPAMDEAIPEEPVPQEEPMMDEAVPAEPVPAEEPVPVDETPQPEVVTADPTALTDDVQVPDIASVPVEPAAPAPEAIPATPVAVQPEVQPVVVPANETAAPVENPAVSVAPEITPVATQEAATATMVAQPAPVAVPVQPEVQPVAVPAQVVPTAQIAQGVPETSMVPPVQFDQNVAGSFKPDATLDEVVKGAQDMFMEGVKNLVQTIQEKVYRDLYVKEAEMKKREALVAQKEQMLNTQFATMMNNITANFNGVNMDPATINANPTNPQQ